MKKLAIVLALFLIAGSLSLFAQDRYTLTPENLSAIKNPTAFTRQYDVWVVQFVDLPANINWSSFNRVIVRVKISNHSGRELKQGHGNVITTIFYENNPANHDDPKFPLFSIGPNVPFRSENLGETGPAAVSTDKGDRITLNKMPGGIVLQNGNTTTAFIEIMEITFFKN